MDDELKKHLYDALESANLVRSFIEGKSFNDFKNDEMLKSAVERKLEIVGEALNRIKRIDLNALNSIREWRDIIAFRNQLAHAYDHISDKLVWSIIEDDLNSLISDLEAALA